MESPPPSAPTTGRVVAVLEIGSTGIRLLVAEIACGTWKELDRAGRPAALGRDVFTSGVLSRGTMLESLSILKQFRELLAGWGIAPEQVHTIATSAVRAARNRDVFVDRVKHEAGFDLAIIEGVEENRLMYLAVRHALKHDLPLIRKANSMIIEIGGGSTEIMLLRRGKMAAAHSLRLGSILIDQRFRDNPRSERRYLNENVRNTARNLSAEMGLAHVRAFVIAGSDARITSAIIGREVNSLCRVINADDFAAFADRVRPYSVEECVEKFHIPFGEAEGFVPGLQIYRLFLEETAAREVIVPLVSIREGYLLDLALGRESAVEEDFFSQIVASAVNLGRKFRFDEAHARHVARLSLSVFDSLSREHGMGRRERMLLETAALLHDIGAFLKPARHEEHGRYLISNSDIFGLHRGELELVALTVLCHRGPLPEHETLGLRREDRVTVLKLAAMLRVADALDRGHSRQVQDIAVERRGETVVLRTSGAGDLSLEQMGLEEKGGLFQDVFGYRVVLQ